MIKLTRLNGSEFNLNALYIEQVEALPDTTISLINGKKFVVREDKEKVLKMIMGFYKDVSIFGALKDVEGD
ncbi:flagellar FlbD family protein [Bacillus solimangrovi]|uniref:Flagellar protein FlbD n=1 Tax=Bacillus solimangrovi TaxID=1305675 RepID=A0A1E5LB10_9BACI|nr:flagellar FlbD family protein [Bacillus solimangrovi]OEH91268.1 hypothetical protein BFG57_06520 [Bacillus solimangrovi]